MNRVDGRWLLCLLVLGMLRPGPAAASADGDPGRMEMTVVVAAPLEETWDLFTTKEGIESWMVPVAEVDWRVGGSIRTNYDPEVGVGGPGTIVHHILSYEPYVMYSSRFEAPESAPPPAHTAEATWGITRFEPVGPERTRVTFTSLGWGEGEEWDAAREFFERGNRWTFEQLVKRVPGSTFVAHPREEADRVVEILGRLAGSAWVARGQAPGEGPRARNVVQRGPGGSGFVIEGWRSIGGEMTFHAATQIWREPETREVRFQALDHLGGVARGAIVLDGPDTLLWEWRIQGADGSERLLWVRTRLEDEDRYIMQMAGKNDADAWSESPPLAFHRRPSNDDEEERVMGGDSKEWLYRLEARRLDMLREGPTPAEMEVLREHSAYLRRLTEEGTIILAGRTLTEDESTHGIVVFRAPDEETAREIMRSDPAVARGVMTAELFPYSVAFRGP